MGIEGRDYYRQSSDYTGRLGGWGWGVIPPVCKWIIIINIVVFLLQIFITRQPRREDYERFLPPQVREEWNEAVSEDEHPDLTAVMPKISIVQEWLQLETRKVLYGQIWRLVTNAFCHDFLSPWHLVFNMLFFYWFGPTLEGMYGSREFLLFYLSAAISASLAYVGLDLVTGESSPAIGASGAVMAVTMLFAGHFPRHVIYIFFVIPVEIRWLVVLYVIFDLHPVLLALAGHGMFAGADRVAHAAHLGGLAFGFIYWKYNVRLEPILDRLRLPSLSRVFGPRRKLRVYRPTEQRAEPEGELDAQVDEILRKLHEHGEASLTDQERQALAAASRRYRDRNR